MLPLLFDGLAGRIITGGDFSAAELDLGLMASVAGRAPLGLALHRQLLSLAPQGRIQDMRASWEGPLEQPTRYKVTARLEGLRLEPGLEPAPSRDGHASGRPGVRGATIQLEATESGGRADVMDVVGSHPGGVVHVVDDRGNRVAKTQGSQFGQFSTERRGDVGHLVGKRPDFERVEAVEALEHALRQFA